MAYPTVRFEEAREWHRTDDADVPAEKKVAYGRVPPQEGEWEQFRRIIATAVAPHRDQEFGLQLLIREAEFRFGNLDVLKDLRWQMENAITVAILKDANPDNPAAPVTADEETG